MITAPFTTPFYEGSGAPAGMVPWPWDVAIAGRTFMLDRKSDQYAHQSIPLTKPQSDDSGEIGEQSVSPDTGWRRSQSSWHRGAGQDHFDLDQTPIAEGSERAQFRSSKGVNVWKKGQLSLLHDTESLADGQVVAHVGNYLYVADDDDIDRYQISGAAYGTASTVTYAGGNVLSAATDGTTVWLTDGSNVYELTGTTASSWNTLDCDLLGWVKNRLMAAHDNAIYNITSSSPPSALFTHPNSSWRWVGFAAGANRIYAAGFAGDKSLIYRIGIVDDATALDVPIVAGELPDGEIVRAVYGYLGFLLIGTDKGVRFAISNSAGDLTLGGLIETPGPVRCFEGQSRFVWFGIDTYDSVSSGLGRLDLSQILDGQRPAWASDLMATGQGQVTHVLTHGDRTVFIAAGSVYFEKVGTYVDRGDFTSGWISFGVPETKLATFLQVRHDSLDAGIASHEAWLRSDDGTPWVQIGYHGGATGETFPASQRQGERFEVSMVLRPADGISPVITRWTLQAQPAPGSVERRIIFLPLLLADKYERDGRVYDGDPLSDRQFIEQHRANAQVVTITEPDGGWQAVLEDWEWRPQSLPQGRRAWNGTMLVKAKVV